MSIPPDSDFVFYMQVFKDYHLAKASLSRLRKIYPTSRLIVISDGDNDVRYKTFEKDFCAEYILGEKLYNVSRGGEMIHRIIETYMKKPAAYLVKLDTDTRVDRKFKCRPEGSYLFGHLANHGCLQGGCIVIPHEVCKKFYDSKVFLSEELKDWKTSWGQLATTPHSKHLLEVRATQKKLIGFEWALLWGCRKLGIESKSFAEIYSKWHGTIANSNLEFAVVHPDKWMTLPLPLWLLYYFFQNIKNPLKKIRSFTTI